MSERVYPLIAWVTVALMFWVTVKFVLVSPEDYCLLSGGRWQPQWEICFFRIDPSSD